MEKTIKQEIIKDRKKVWESNKITMDEHKKFGEMCKVMHDKLSKAWSYKYGTTNEMNSSKELKCVNLVDKLKCYMEDIMFDDYNTDKEATTNIYYGTNKWRETNKETKQ